MFAHKLTQKGITGCIIKSNIVRYNSSQTQLQQHLKSQQKYKYHDGHRFDYGPGGRLLLGAVGARLGFGLSLLYYFTTSWIH